MLEAVVAGILLGLALVFSVGPVVFTIIKLRINYGLQAAFYFIFGVWFSDLLWVITANVFGNLLGNIITYKLLIGSAGGLFLFSLGIYYLFFKKYHSKAELDEGIVIKNTTHLRMLVTGFLINTLNPGVIALWLAAATKAIDYTIEQKFVTFTICLGTNICADFFKIKLAGRLRAKLTEKNIKIVNRISGMLYLVFGLALIAGVIISTLKS